MAEPRYQSHIAVLGLKETLRALDQMDRRTRKETRKELHDAAERVAELSRTYVDPDGLSGWRRWKGGYDASRIAGGIRLTSMERRGFGGQMEINYIAVVNSNVAGAIWEIAGRKKLGRLPRKGRERTVRGMRWSKTRGRYIMGNIGTGELRQGGWGNGRAFVAGIKRHGASSSREAAGRTVWYAYDVTNAGYIKRQVEQMLIREGRTTQRQIDLNPY